MDRGGDDGDDFEGMLPEDNLAEDAAGIPADLLDDEFPTTAATLPQTTNQKKKAKQKQVYPFSFGSVSGCSQQ